ncbi:MAG TPA: META domain-containing protein, partial [Nitrospiraceae bacterium]|nr:META domain-containing protein [Nitrospiraceae bacterium]
MKWPCILIIGLTGLVAACRSDPTSPSPSSTGSLTPSVDAVRASPLTPPVTFTGDIPCADCSGQRLTVTLRPGGIVLLRQTYGGVAAGKDEHRHELGRWAVSEDGTRLILQSSAEGPRQFTIINAGRLRMLTTEGQEIRSHLNYDLTRSERVDPIDDTISLRGMFTYMADAPLLTECRTGMRFPVAQEGDYLALERAYLGTRRTPGEPLLVTFEGRLTSRPVGEGESLKDAAVVGRFDRIWPGETCARQTFSTASLATTYWRPVELAGKPVAIATGEREPHLMLVPGENKLRGFAGCNQFQGRYDVRDSSLRFTGVATTRKFCEGAMDQEQEFLRVLEGTASH